MINFIDKHTYCYFLSCALILPFYVSGALVAIGSLYVELDFWNQNFLRNLYLLTSSSVAFVIKRAENAIVKTMRSKELNLQNKPVLFAHPCQEFFQMNLRTFLFIFYFAESYGNFKDKFISFSFDKEEFLFLGKVQDYQLRE